MSLILLDATGEKTIATRRGVNLGETCRRTQTDWLRMPTLCWWTIAFRNS